MAKKRITKVYTKTGDGGETSLVGGMRASKDSARVAAYGDVDELNSSIGAARSFCSDEEILSVLSEIQNDLFILGSDLASPPGVDAPRIDAARTEKLEGWLDRFLETMEPLKEFILPAGTPAGAALHLARAVCRRAERSAVSLMKKEKTSPDAVVYLNRLSDLLFVLARASNIREGFAEVPVDFGAKP
ncbi:MAG: cob(I)yrinic acid a,c-diamide adenosyltransferase [Candidatus Dadabacteria bacterium]|nr:cob(I)yrinic acid a,c-diamide adenosyltransferase [Candidatus Dadabacteria bacterium]MCY4046605.1 cob(I)yrinic acid a,c-diamide adenosyltransferase [Candidatus Dadabacteria bacterium]